MTCLNISTVNYIANSNVTDLDLKEIYENIEVIDYDYNYDAGIIKKTFKENTVGFNKKDKTTKTSPKKGFRNQISFDISNTQSIELSKTDKIIFNEYSNFHKKDKETFDEYTNYNNMYYFQQSKSFLPIKEIHLVLNENAKLNDEIIIISTSSKKKNQDKILIKYTVKQYDINNKFVNIDLTRKYQITGLYVKSNNVVSCNIKAFVETSLFLFNTGKLKISGCTSDKGAQETFNVFKQYFDKLGYDIILNSLDIIMINSNFSMNTRIDLNILEEIVKEKELIYNYDTLIHPALKIKFMYNEQYDTCGKCNCKNKYKQTMVCSGIKKRKSNCKAITILAYSTGSIMVMGTNNFDQLNHCYNYIHSLLEINLDKIKT